MPPASRASSSGSSRKPAQQSRGESGPAPRRRQVAEPLPRAREHALARRASKPRRRGRTRLGSVRASAMSGSIAKGDATISLVASSSTLPCERDRPAAASPRYPRRFWIASCPSAAKTSSRIPSFAACRPSPASRSTFATRARATSSAATCTARSIAPGCIARPPPAWNGGRRLADVAPGHRLLVLDALRPHRVQIELWDFLDGTGLRQYVADPARGSIHSFGMALDVTLSTPKAASSTWAAASTR